MEKDRIRLYTEGGDHQIEVKQLEHGLHTHVKLGECPPTPAQLDTITRLQEVFLIPGKSTTGEPKPPRLPWDKLRDWVQKADPVMKVIGGAKIIWDILQSFFGFKRQPSQARPV